MYDIRESAAGLCPGRMDRHRCINSGRTGCWIQSHTQRTGNDTKIVRRWDVELRKNFDNPEATTAVTYYSEGSITMMGQSYNHSIVSAI